MSELLAELYRKVVSLSRSTNIMFFFLNLLYSYNVHVSQIQLTYHLVRLVTNGGCGTKKCKNGEMLDENCECYCPEGNTCGTTDDKRNGAGTKRYICLCCVCVLYICVCSFLLLRVFTMHSVIRLNCIHNLQ